MPGLNAFQTVWGSMKLNKKVEYHCFIYDQETLEARQDKLSGILQYGRVIHPDRQKLGRAPERSRVTEVKVAVTLKD